MIFWNYFKKLGFILLRETGIFSGLVKGAAASLDDARKNELWLRNQFIPAKMEDIKKLAAARGILKFQNETDGLFITRILNAYTWWKKSGTEKGMIEILTLYLNFSDISIQDMREIDPARWAEFSIGINTQEEIQAEKLQLIKNIVDELKPARSKLANIDIKMETECDARVAIAMQVAEEITVQSLTPIIKQSVPISIGIGFYIENIIKQEE
ncbi:putative DUF2313 domain-containing protein [Candidatus Magnetomoraceae bacterium gMMP-15]